MIRKFLATDVEGIEGVGAICAVFEEAFFLRYESGKPMTSDSEDLYDT